MNEDQLLQLQAWVDGELPEGEARRVAQQVETDPDARALVAELKMTKAFLAGNEPEYQLQESREFYWTKIQREIQGQEAAPTRPVHPAWIQTWRRFLVPASGLALILFASVISLKFSGGFDDGLRHLAVGGVLDDRMDSMVYRSQSDNIFVVYVFNKDREPAGEEDWDLEDAPLQ